MPTRKEKIFAEMKKRKELKMISPLEAWVIDWLHKCHIYEFDQEYQIGPYLADLFFPRIKLVVELDGQSFHADEKQQKRDRVKNEYIRSQGIKVERWCSTKCWNPKLLSHKIAKLFEQLYPSKRLPFILTELGMIGEETKEQAVYDNVLHSWISASGLILKKSELQNYQIT